MRRVTTSHRGAVQAPGGGVEGDHWRAGRPQLLRLSVTERCNLRCRYCWPELHPRGRDHAELPLARLAEVVAWLVQQVDVDRVKLTGGEPLLRRGVCDLVQRLARLPGVEEVSATTNGSLLADLAGPLRRAGLRRVNVSLDAADPLRFARVTGGGELAAVLGGIEAARAAGLAPVKLNSVLLASTWREDVPALLDLARKHGLEVRFIELMHTGTEAAWADREFVSARTVRQWLVGTAAGSIWQAAGGPARTETLAWRGSLVRVGWICPRSARFCGTCDRLRLDAAGRLRRCLMEDCSLPLAELLSHDGETRARRALAAWLDGKRPPARMSSDLPMVRVGG